MDEARAFPLAGLKVTMTADGCWVRWPDGKQEKISIEQADAIWRALGNG